MGAALYEHNLSARTHFACPSVPGLMGIGIVLALLATQAQTAALAHSARESETELMKKRMQTLFPMGVNN